MIYVSSLQLTFFCFARFNFPSEAFEVYICKNTYDKKEDKNTNQAYSHLNDINYETFLKQVNICWHIFHCGIFFFIKIH